MQGGEIQALCSALEAGQTGVFWLLGEDLLAGV